MSDDPYSPYVDKGKAVAWETWDNYLPETRVRMGLEVEKAGASCDILDLMREFGEKHPHVGREYVPLERKQK